MFGKILNALLILNALRSGITQQSKSQPEILLKILFSKGFKIVFLTKNYLKFLNPLSANTTKWSNILKQFVGNLPTNCLSVFDHFVKLALEGLSRDGVVFILICNFIFFLCYLSHIKFLNTIVILSTLV